MSELQTGIPRVYSTGDKGTFGEFTAAVRWPAILQNASDDLELAINQAETQLKKEQGKIISEQIVQLKQDVETNSKPALLPEEYEVFNKFLKENDTETWKNGDWLFLEILLYRKVNLFFKGQSEWANFDIFDRLKTSTFESSKAGVLDLATYYHGVVDKFNGNEDAIPLLFQEFIEISLWGNATDLSLLATATVDDISAIQDSANRLKQKSNILIDDTANAYKHLVSQNGDARVDFILDNSGFELYTDLLFAAFMLDSKLASSVVLHGKDIPYMVSDVMIKDFEDIIKQLEDPKFFVVKDRTHLDFITQKIKNYAAEGKISIKAHPFWTGPLDFWHIDPTETQFGGAECHKDLSNSKLCIFKGDLNYRKLTGDRIWPRTTPWATSIGPLKDNGLVTLSLRTAKADVIVGLKEGEDEKLSKYWGEQGNENGSWWTSSGKWAVICFNDGNN
ncbi:unnamed protein product [Kluyveromyces dobzhanskii CBS 2104]|uniref:Sugar phosphate phosphatase n=1 Tax=Kluyveromyces dobzhanskii CBS 2104 TaxID=1427455 RepID=A0A0A8L920_9SACH|nr:unnamed protein product [Kluyveromyces dobzhanskii CBS 2104]